MIKVNNYPLHQWRRATQQPSSSRTAFCLSPATTEPSPGKMTRQKSRVKNHSWPKQLKGPCHSWKALSPHRPSLQNIDPPKSLAISSRLTHPTPSTPVEITAARSFVLRIPHRVSSRGEIRALHSSPEVGGRWGWGGTEGCALR